MWKHESGAEKSRNPLVHPQPMEVELAEKFLSIILDWKKNWSHVFTSHIGRGLERVDTGITRTSREWRPEGSPTNGQVTALGLQSLGILSHEARQHLNPHWTLNDIYRIRIECLSGENRYLILEIGPPWLWTLSSRHLFATYMYSVNFLWYPRGNERKTYWKASGYSWGPYFITSELF